MFEFITGGGLKIELPADVWDDIWCRIQPLNRYISDDRMFDGHPGMAIDPAAFPKGISLWRKTGTLVEKIEEKLREKPQLERQLPLVYKDPCPDCGGVLLDSPDTIDLACARCDERFCVNNGKLFKWDTVNATESL